MVMKIVAHGPTRRAAIDKLRAAIAATTIGGISTNLTYLDAVLNHPAFRRADLSTDLLAELHAELVAAVGTMHSAA